MSKGSKRRQENFRAVQDNWPKNMGPKNTWSEFSDKFYEENKELLDSVYKSIDYKEKTKNISIGEY